MTFSIVSIAEHLQLELVRRAGEEYIFICPFCSGQKKYPKLYVNGIKGVFICHHCHLEGSVTELWAMRCGVDTKTAYKQMVNSIPCEVKPIDLPLEKPRDEEKLHAVYSDFMKMLTLGPLHRHDLIRRGLPESKFGEFRSLPEDPKTRWNICRVLDKKYGLDDVPGFQQKTSQKGKPYWDCLRSGMLIPTRNVKGRITGFQVRTGGDPKYIWFAYSGQTKAQCHIIPGKGVPWIIEGVLKSYVAHHFLNIPCIGIPGTNTWRTVPVDLIRGGEIVVAYDMEMNEYTHKARDELIKHLEGQGFKVTVAGWNKNLGKGIDDACLTLVKRGIKPSPDLFLPGIAA